MSHLRQEFRAAARAIPPTALVFLDETGTYEKMARTHARAPRGQRAYAVERATRARQVTLLAAISLTKSVYADRTYLGAMNTPRFLTWLDTALVPALEPGQVVVMDNLRVHHVAGVRQGIEATGCRVLYLAPYSPEYNPIELAWAKLKAYLRKRTECTVPHLRRAVHWGMRTIRPTDVRHWFAHAGYPL